MRIIDAYWEKRNLGVDVTEVVCSEADSVDELKETLRQIQTPYSVVKVPAGSVPLLLTAQQCDYSLIEASISYQGSLKSICPPRVYGHFTPYVSISSASPDMVERALLEMESGSVFTTDRIALDPLFSKEIAGKRYANWCRDEMEDGAERQGNQQSLEAGKGRQWIPCSPTPPSGTSQPCLFLGRSPVRPIMDF